MKIYKLVDENKKNEENIYVFDSSNEIIMNFLFRSNRIYSIRFMSVGYDLNQKMIKSELEINLYEFLIIMSGLEKEELIKKLIVRIIRTSIHKAKNIDNLLLFFKENIGTNETLNELIEKKNEFQNYLSKMKKEYKEIE